MKRVLIIDDAGQDLEAFGRLLREHGYAATELVGCAGDVQDALRQSEECYRDIFENAPIGIFRTSLDGMFVSANPAMARMLKYDSPAELIRAVNCKNIAEVLYVEPEHRQEVMKSVLLHNGWQIFEERFRCKDGSVITCNFHLRAVRGDGEIVGLDGFAADLTERKRVEEALQSSNNLLRAVIEAAPTAIIGMDLDGNVQNVWNPAAEKMLGWSAHEVMGRPLPSVPAEYREEFSVLQERKRGGETMDGVEVSRLRRDGTPIEYSIYSSPLYDAEGRITGNIGVLVDITERKKTEVALRLSQFILDKASIGIFRGDGDARILSVNEHGAKLLGYTPEELCSMRFFDIDPKLTPETWLEHRNKLTSTGSNTFESVHRRKDGTVFPVEVTVNYLKFDGYEFSCSFSRDISERKRTEEALRVSEQKCRAIVEHAPFGICRSTRDGKVLGVNPAFARILKYDSPEALRAAVNRSSIQEVLFEEPSRRAPLVEQIFEGDSWQVFENRYRCGDGSIITCKVHARRVLDPGGSESEFESFLENITERLEAEKALRESEEKFRVLAETAPAAIVVYQGEKFVYVNPAATRLFGFSEEELLAMNFWDWATEESREIVRERGLARQRGEQVPCQYEHGFVNKRGETGWAMVSAGAIVYRGKPAGIATFIDVTEIKRTEQRLQTSLAEKEILLKEVHHRVKNNLQIISSLLDLQSDYIPEVHSRRFIRESQDRIRSMALVHEQLYKSEGLAFIDFSQYVDVLVTSLYQSCVVDQERIRVKVDVRDIALDIDEAIPCGLIINELVSNALKHAFPGDRSGDVVISGTMAGDGLVSLSVADSGVGLPPGLDFLNTESLGLQIVNLLTNQLRGSIDMQGGEGVTVNICFRAKSKS